MLSVRNKKVKKRVYVLTVITSIFVFTGPILDFINEMTIDWAETQKNTITNGELLVVFLLMLGGSILLSAIAGLLICAVIRLVAGKRMSGQEIEEIAEETKKRKEKKLREPLSKKEIFWKSVAIIGLLLALSSFLFCTGIEYTSFDSSIFNAATYSELEGAMEDAVFDMLCDAEGISGKWGLLLKIMLASESGESISLWSFLVPDKILVLSLLAIIISAVQLRNECGTKRINIATIIIAVISLLLNKFFSPWIQLCGAVLYNSFVTSAINMFQVMKQTIDAYIELFSPFLSEEFLNQKYIDN